MSIRGWERSTLLIAASAAAVMGLAACGPTSEPTGDESSPETSASQPEEASPTPESTPTSGDEPTAEGSSPAGAPPSSSAPPEPSQPASEPGGKQSGKTAGAAPDKDDNDPSLCDAADLKGSIEEIRGGAAAGSVHRGLMLTNTSNEPCILKGFPGVSYVDAAGNQVGAPADRNTSTASPALDLQPGESAMATLRMTRAENYGPKCNQTQAAGLRVYPPSAYDSLIIDEQFTACAADGVVLMTIGAFQPMK